MRSVILSIAALLIIVGCVLPQRADDEKIRMVHVDKTRPTEIWGLDFGYRKVRLASVRALRRFFREHEDHQLTSATDLDRICPLVLMANGSIIHKDNLKTWPVPIYLEVPEVGYQYARKASVQVEADGPDAWKVVVRVHRLKRTVDPTLKEHEGYYIVGEAEVYNEIKIVKNIHLELEKIKERERKQEKELDY